MVYHSYGGCPSDYGWMAVSHGSTCPDWTPSEGTTIPSISYSTEEDSNGNYVYGHWSSTVNIADTMVIYVNAIDSSIFGLTNEPTILPTNLPTNNPTQPTIFHHLIILQYYLQIFQLIFQV